MTELLERHRAKLEEALEGDDFLGWDDLLRLVDEDRAIVLGDEAGVVVVQLTKKDELVFWLAAGELETVLEYEQAVCEWARGRGIRAAVMEGRRGWEKALRTRGWKPTRTVYRKEI